MILNGTETTKNFKIAFANEFESNNKYTYFTKIAKNEDFWGTNEKFNELAKIDKISETRYSTLLNNLRKKKVFNRTTDVVWVCKKCGYVHIGADAPLSCPVCNSTQNYFEIRDTNY